MLIVKAKEPYMKVEVTLTDIDIDFYNDDLTLSNKHKCEMYSSAYSYDLIKILESANMHERVQIYSNSGELIFDFDINYNTKISVIPEYIKETEEHSGFCAIVFDI
jgi:hypothetical protein